ncbi:MAG: hypothetical protein LUQ51_06485, partial [Methanothrix sp.]|nr:hypothetical protein [Methanothrix sp.]
GLLEEGALAFWEIFRSFSESSGERTWSKRRNGSLKRCGRDKRSLAGLLMFFMDKVTAEWPRS